MSAYEYGVFLLSQALSEVGDHLWSLGLRNFLFENSPWSPAIGLAAFFVIQAIPVFLFAPWLTQSIQHRWRAVALAADAGRMIVTLSFALFLLMTKTNALETQKLIFALLGVQFLLEFGTLIFQNCRNCLIPILYPKPDDISRAHLWANVASLSAAGIVPLLFFVLLPTGQNITLAWLLWTALIDAFTFALSGCALLALKHSQKLKDVQNQIAIDSQQANTLSPWQQMKRGFATAKKYPAVTQILGFSFFYNLLLMGPVEIGLVTFLRRDLQLPPSSLAINLVLFVGGVFAGTLLANKFWSTRNAHHLKRFSYSIFWDGVTFFPLCLFSLCEAYLPRTIFLLGLGSLFFAHYIVVPFVKVSRIAALQSLSEKKDWSTLLGFHTIAVEGAGAVSVICIAFLIPEMSGAKLLAWGGLGATLCGLIGIFRLARAVPQLGPDTIILDTQTNPTQGL